MNWRTLTSIYAFGVLITAGGSQSALGQGLQTNSASLEIKVTGIRKQAGVIRLALCPPDEGFPNCGSHAVRTGSLRIDKGQAHITLSGLAPGSYALSVFHDANGNGVLDTFAGIPREGYGFSNNPPFRPRAPRFAEGEIAVSGATTATINLRYIL